MKQNQKKIAVYVFCFAIAAPMLLWTLGIGQDFSENRKPAAFPEVKWSGIRRATWFQDYSDYLRDHLPFRQHAVAFYTNLSLKQLGETGSRQVSLGRDGWLFYEEELNQQCVEEAEITRRLHALRDLLASKSKNGKRVVFIIAPDKASIYPELLTGKQKRKAECSVKNREVMRRVLSDASFKPYILPLWDMMEKAKAETPMPVFRKYDTHWNYTGASKAAAVIMEWLKPGAWNEAWIKPGKAKARTGDLSRMLGVDLAEEELPLTLKIPGAESKKSAEHFCTNYEKLKVNDTRVAIAEEGTAKLVDGHSVLVRDSFFVALRPFIVPYMAQLDTVHFTELPKYDLPKIGECADLLILETVERHALLRTEQVISAFAAESKNP